jgi:hypothetical protein
MNDFEALKRKFVFPAPFSAHGQKTVEGCLPRQRFESIKTPGLGRL